MARKSELRAPWKLLVTAGVAGFSFGMFQCLSFTGVFGQTAWYAFGVVGFLLAALLFAVITLILRMNFNYMIYYLSFVLMAAGGFVFIAAPDLADWGYGLFCVGYRCFDMLVWCLCAYLIYHRHVAPVWLGGMCIGALLCGRFLGFSVFTLLHGAPLEITNTSLIATVVFILFLTALFLVSRNNLIEAWGMVKLGDVNDKSESIALYCDYIKNHFSLSLRECDVLEHLAQGSSRAEIGKELILSEETIKTHIHHIYQKCGIHSRKELESLFNSVQSELILNQLDLREKDSFE